MRGIVGALAAFVAFFVGFTAGLIGLGMYALNSSSDTNLATLLVVGAVCGALCAWLVWVLVSRLHS